MARINIEDSLFADGRFLLLKAIVGSETEAIGKLVVAWRTAQSYWLKDEFIPKRFWEILKLDELIEVGFAEIHANGIYVCGVEKHFEWIKQKQEAGKKSGIARKEQKIAENERKVNENERTLDSRSNETSTEKEPLTLTPPLTLTLPTPTSTKEKINFKNSIPALGSVDQFLPGVSIKAQHSWLEALFYPNDWLQDQIRQCYSTLTGKEPKTTITAFYNTYLQIAWARDRDILIQRQKQKTIEEKERAEFERLDAEIKRATEEMLAGA